MNSFSSPDEIRLFLEWAGQRILTLRVNNIYPQSYRSFWPDYPDEAHTAYGYSGVRFRPPPPSKDEIPLVDEILSLILLVPNVRQRRILNARCLVSPVSGRYVYPWTKIARLLKADVKTIKIHHGKGLETICKKISERDVGRFREIVGLTQ